MAGGISIQATGIDKVIKRFGQIPKDVAEVLDAELAAAGDDFVDRSVTDAPKDRGQLHQTISKRPVKELVYEVVCSSEVAAYMEFGTRTRVVVPADLEAYAAQFRGPGGGKGNAKQAIYDWCKRQGIEEQFWRPIFIKIMTKGVNPHPFFFKQRKPVLTALQQHIQPAINKALS